MIRDTIEKIEERVRSSGAIKEESKAELLNLLGTIKQEMTGLAETHGEDAQSIAGFTEVSAHEATRETKSPELLELSLKGLSSSAADRELPPGARASRKRVLHRPGQSRGVAPGSILLTAKNAKSAKGKRESAFLRHPCYPSRDFFRRVFRVNQPADAPRLSMRYT